MEHGHDTRLQPLTQADQCPGQREKAHGHPDEQCVVHLVSSIEGFGSGEPGLDWSKLRAGITPVFSLS